MTLFTHTIEGLNENFSTNNLDHWFDGFSSGEEALEIYSDSFTGETEEEEMVATVKALNEMFKYDVADIEHAHAQAIIEEWNISVWGKNFTNNDASVPFSG